MSTIHITYSNTDYIFKDCLTHVYNTNIYIHTCLLHIHTDTSKGARRCSRRGKDAQYVYTYIQIYMYVYIYSYIYDKYNMCMYKYICT